MKEKSTVTYNMGTFQTYIHRSLTVYLSASGDYANEDLNTTRGTYQLFKLERVEAVSSRNSLPSKIINIKEK